MSASATRAAVTTAANTYTDVVSVTRKLRADLLQVLDHYGYFSGAYAEQIVHDLRVMVDEDIVEWAQLTWRSPSSNTVLAAFRYTVVLGDIGLADNRPGGIPCRPDLKAAHFNVHVSYNAKGRTMSAAAKAELPLELRWSPGAHLSYSGSSWSSDRSYASNGTGLKRTAFG